MVTARGGCVLVVTAGLWLVASCGTGVDVGRSETTGRVVQMSHTPFAIVDPNEAIEPSTPVGTLPGTFVVSPNGSAEYTIPLDVPEGRAGMAPSLALSYDSRGSNGLLGLGWSLTGLSAITRCARTLAQDDETDGIRFDATDRYCLDGQRLVAIRGAYGADGTEYRTERDIFARIFSFGSLNSGPAQFVVWTQDGRILSFGNTAVTAPRAQRLAVSNTDNTISAELVTHSWLLAQVSDRAGNSYTIQYGQSPAPALATESAVEWWPARIDYTSGANDTVPQRWIEFLYDTTRPDPHTGFVGGVRIRASRLLRRIEMHAPGGIAPTGLVRAYELGYAANSVTRRSRLTSLRVCDGRGTCLPPTTFEWELGRTDYAVWHPGITDVGTDWQAWRGMHTMDVNGDGLTDLVYKRREADDRIRWYVRLGTGTNSGFSASMPSGLPVFQPLYDPYSQPLDYDNDGRIDLLFETRDPAVNATTDLVHRWNGSRFEPILDPIASANWEYYQGRPPAFLVDINGDGLLDNIQTWFYEPQNTRWVYRLHDGTGWGPFRDSGFIASVYRRANQVLDVNSNGRADLLAPHVPLTPSPIGPGLALDALSVDRAGNALIRPTNLDTDDCALVADINGDGLGDWVVMRDPPRIRLNTGRGFLPAYDGRADPSQNIGGSRVCLDPYTAPGRDAGFRVLDFDGDGNQDVLLMDTMLLLRSNGTHFEQVQLPYTPGTRTQWDYATSRVLELNGDGLPDLLQLRNDQIELLRRNGLPPDVIHTITNGLGARVQVQYRPLTDPNVYTLGTGCAYPARCLTGTMQLVAEHQESNGISPSGMRQYRYRYRDGRVNLRGRGWIGFASRTVRDEQTGMERTTRYDVTTQEGNGVYAYAQVPLQEEVLVPLAGGPTRRVMRTFRYEWHPTQTGIEDGRQYQAGTTRVREVVYRESDVLDPNTADVVLRALTTSYDTYDDFDHVSQETTGTPTEYTRTTRRFDNLTDPWLIGLLREEVITSVAPPGPPWSGVRLVPQQTRRVTYVYNLSTGLRTDEQIDGTPTSSMRQRHYDRNLYGVVTRIIDRTASTVDPARTVEMTYDPEGIYPVTITNARGHVTTQQYHPALGVLVAQADPNGVQSRWRYDGFGRNVASIPAGAGTTHVTYAASEGGFRIARHTDGGSEVEVRYDRLGRPIEQMKRGFDGNWITQSVEYNSLGYVGRVTRPHVSGATFIPAVSYTYDPLGRIVTEHGPIPEQIVTTRYEGLSTTRTDARGHNTTTVVDAWGRLVARTDAAGTTRYAYGPFSNLTMVTDPAGHVTRQLFDARGNRIRLLDPDTGTHLYQYNGYDELYSDSVGGTFVWLERDVLGRVTVRHEGGETARWTWDTATHGIGRVGRTESSTRVPTTYTYDEFGRIASVTTGQYGPFTVRYRYDMLGRLDTITYPPVPGVQAFVVQQEYTAYGALRAVRDANTGAAFWTARVAAPDGQLTHEVFGNGLETQRVYSPITGQLTHLKTYRYTGADSPPAGSDPCAQGPCTVSQSLDYSWDLNGNLTSRHDALQPISSGLGAQEVFGYDELDRLATVRLDNGPIGRFEYNVDGNLLRRPGMDGTLGYGEGENAGPHAVTSLGAEHYTYDRAGRQIQGPDREIGYTAFDLPKWVKRGSTTTMFTYDADQHRVTAGNTLYVGDLYEQRESQHIYYVHASGRVVAQVRPAGTQRETRYVHDDHLGSTDLVTDAAGAVVERQSFDPFGLRRNPQWAVTTPPVGAPAVRRGFTGHAHDDDLGLINMRGRMYDPRLGRFLTADPIVPDAADSQSWNPYSYVRNNPLTWIDPSGFNPSGLQREIVRDEGLPGGPSWSEGITTFSDGSRAHWMACINSCPGDPQPRAGASTDLGFEAPSTGAPQPWSAADVLGPGAGWGNTLGTLNTMGKLGLGLGLAAGLVSLAVPAAAPLVLPALTLSNASFGLSSGLQAVTGVNEQGQALSPTERGVQGALSVLNLMPVAGAIRGAAGEAATTGGFWSRLALETEGSLRLGAPSGAAASRVLGFTGRNLQKGFTKHGADFGLTGSWGPGRAADFSRSINQFINNPEVRTITGTYRGNPVTHYVDPTSGLNVIADEAGNYISGWSLGAEQLESVLTSGRLF
jgi:RHS repeat-associated protein